MSAIPTNIIKLFLLIICIIITNGERTRFCKEGTDELFYDNANDFTDWTLDNDDGGLEYYYLQNDPRCSSDDCYYFYTVDYDAKKLINHPSATSVPISTIDYWNINIIFDSSLTQNNVDPLNNAMCVTSYTVDDGTSFTHIHSTVGNSDKIFQLNISKTLNSNADNTILRLKFQIMDNGTDPTEDFQKIRCYYDEILLCGTAITPSPTTNTLPPTTNTIPPTANTLPPSASPTTNTLPPTANTLPPSASPTSDESASEDPASDDSDSSDSYEMANANQMNKKFMGESGNTNEQLEKIITISFSSSFLCTIFGMIGVLCFGVVIIGCIYFNNSKR